MIGFLIQCREHTLFVSVLQPRAAALPTSTFSSSLVAAGRAHGAQMPAELQGRVHQGGPASPPRNAGACGGPAVGKARQEQAGVRHLQERHGRQQPAHGAAQRARVQPRRAAKDGGGERWGRQMPGDGAGMQPERVQSSIHFIEGVACCCVVMWVLYAAVCALWLQGSVLQVAAAPVAWHARSHYTSRQIKARWRKWSDDAPREVAAVRKRD